MARQTIKIKRRILFGGAAALVVSSQTSAQTTDPILIGTVSQLSGALAIVGTEILLGARIAADQINRAGGINGRKIEILPRDDKSNPNEAVVAAQNLIGAGARFIVGPVTTANANAMLPTIVAGKALLVGPALAGMGLTHENFVPNFFRMSSSSWINGRGMAMIMAKTYPGVVKWSCVIPDQAFAHDYWAAFQAGLKEFVPKYSSGAQPIFIDAIQTKYGATDFKNELFKLSTSGAEGIMVSLTGADGITFYSQMHSFGLSTRLKAIIDVAAELTLGRALGSNIPPNIWSFSPWYYATEPGTDIGHQLVADYKAATGHSDPPGLVEASHCCVLGIAAGIRAAGSADPMAVLAAMGGLSFQSANGTVLIRKEDHQMLCSQSYIEMGPTPQPPGWKVVRQIDVNMADLVEPPSPGKKFGF